MKIRVLHNFGVYEKGQVFEDWPGGMCDILIRRGLIEEVETADEQPQAVERADVSSRTKAKKRA